MKSYGNLWETLVSEDNIRKAIAKSSKGKRKRRDVRPIVENPKNYIKFFRNYAEHFENKNHIPRTIYDGISHKKRTIICPKYKEQVVHHMATQALTHVFMKGMYEHSYGSIPKRGSHRGKKVIEKWLRDKKNTKYCLKMDIQKFFDSVNHKILKEKLARLLKDPKTLDLIYKLVDVTDKGLPLGFYTSQWLANWFLQDLDHHIKEVLKAKYYIRYMDDMVIFGSNKRTLHKIKDGVEKYLGNVLGLNLKYNWTVFRFIYEKDGKEYGRFLDFMGFRFYRTRTTLRRTILLKITRKAKHISKKIANIHDARQMLSYAGWFKHTDCYKVYLKYVKPYVSLKRLKKKVSRYDRKEKQCGKQQGQHKDHKKQITQAQKQLPISVKT